MELCAELELTEVVRFTLDFRSPNGDFTLALGEFCCEYRIGSSVFLVETMPVTVTSACGEWFVVIFWLIAGDFIDLGLDFLILPETSLSISSEIMQY